MGIGDELMAAGEARLRHEATLLPVVIVDRHGRPRWSEVWENNPYILRYRPPGAHNTLVNGGGVRPYIVGKGVTKWFWKKYKPIPAEFFFTKAELAFAEPYRGSIMIEPSVKAVGHDNKAWLTDRWNYLAHAIAIDMKQRIVQCVPSGHATLPNTETVLTPTFRLAAAVQSVCAAYIGTEGGLHHAAAANKTPAVILWAEFIDPSITGYTTMINLRHAHKVCGYRVRCSGCRKSMEAITVSEVVSALKRILK